MRRAGGRKPRALRAPASDYPPSSRVSFTFGVDESALSGAPGYHREFRGVVLGPVKESAPGMGVQFEEKGLAKGQENLKS